MPQKPSSSAIPTYGCLVPALYPDLEFMSVVINTSQTFCLTDEVFSRKSKAHRALIRCVSGTQWLTLPVLPSDKKKPLNEVRAGADTNWPEFFMKALQTSYGNSRYFDFYQPEIMADLMHAASLTLLSDITNHLNTRLFCYLEAEPLIHGKITMLSTEAFNRFMEGQAEFGKPSVVIEQRGSYYRKPGDTSRLRITEASFEHPVYEQRHDGFQPGCSLLDLLFQYGPYSYQILEKL